MERVIERGSGLDVHQETVAACGRVPGPQGQREQHVRTFGTTTADLLALGNWLDAHGVTHVARESTGVYWKPVYSALEARCTVLLVNAAHIQQVPGRKTDVADCVWIAQLLEHGLLRGSFAPPAPIRDLQDLTRYRKVLIQDRTREANRLHKVLQAAGIKLASGSRGWRCWRPSSTGPPTRPAWRSWRGASSGRKCPRSSRPSRGASAPPMRSS